MCTLHPKHGNCLPAGLVEGDTWKCSEVRDLKCAGEGHADVPSLRGQLGQGWKGLGVGRENYPLKITRNCKDTNQCPKLFENGFLLSENQELAKLTEVNAICRRDGIFLPCCRQDQLRSKPVTAAAMTPLKGNLSPQAVVLGRDMLSRFSVLFWSL